MSNDRAQQLVQAAFALLADIPLAELSTRQIARRVGVSQPAMFRHFRSRDALLVAVVDSARDTLGAEAVKLLEAREDAVTTLERLAATLMRYVQDNPGLPRLLFSDGAGSGEGMRAALGRLLTMQRSLVAQIVRDGQRSGLLAPQVDPTRAAWLFVGMLQGLVLQWQLEGRQEHLVDEAPAMMALWLGGVGARRDPSPQDHADRAAAGVPLQAGEAPSKGLKAPREAPESGPPTQDGIGAIDVRDILAGGRDPLEDILATLEPLRPGAAMLVTAPFRPAPLLALLSRQGHRLHERALPDGGCAVAVAVQSGAQIADLCDLEPPEPMEAVLTMAQRLQPGEAWIAWLPRHPRLLLPVLAQRPVTCALSPCPDGAVLLHMRRNP